jgi:hypothetical protein
MENEMQLKNIHHNGTKVGNDTLRVSHVAIARGTGCE